MNNKRVQYTVALKKGKKPLMVISMGQMFAPMIVGGFVTVTITSVMIAGVFANML